MADLRERFRAADLVEAPDLWSDIDKRIPSKIPDDPGPARRAVVIVVALAVVAGAAVIAGNAFLGGSRRSSPIAPNPITARNGLITFSTGSGSGGLFTIGSDGHGLARMHLAGANPSWAPDGRHFVFTAGTRHGTGLFRATARGGDVHRISPPKLFVSQPSWSPDGSHIAFVGVGPDGAIGDGLLYVMRADGSDVRRLTPTAAWGRTLEVQLSTPAWSPDSSRLAFVAVQRSTSCSGPHCPFSLDIFAIRADGSGLRAITRHNVGSFGVAWSPDGTKLAFTVGRKGKEGLYVMSARGGTARMLSSCRSKPGLSTTTQAGCLFDRAVAWAPDGKSIVFASLGTSGSTLWRIGVGGGGLRRLFTTSGTIGWISWQRLPIASGAPTPTPGTTPAGTTPPPITKPTATPSPTPPSA